MKDYLGMASIQLRDAKEHQKLWAYDDLYVDSCCQRLADGVEYCLRYVAAMSGTTAPRGHNLRNMVSYVSPQICNYQWFQNLQDLVRYMGDWHTGMAYFTDFSGDAKRASEVIDLLQVMLEDLHSFKAKSITEISPEDRIQAVLDRNNTGLKTADIYDLLPVSYKSDSSIAIDVLNDVVMMAVRMKKKLD